MARWTTVPAAAGLTLCTGLIAALPGYAAFGALNTLVASPLLGFTVAG